MPKNHQLYQWDAQRFKNWASNIGTSTYDVISKHILKYKVEEQSYKGCLSLLKLSDKYTATRLASAFGVNACRHKLKVKYIRLPELLSEFEIAKIQGNYRKGIKQLTKYDLLILDELLLCNTNEIERNDLLELMESRCNKKSTILCS